MPRTLRSTTAPPPPARRFSSAIASTRATGSSSPRASPGRRRASWRTTRRDSPSRSRRSPTNPRTGRLDLNWLKSAVGAGDVFGALVDIPNGFGHLDEGLPEVKALLGGAPLVAVADPLSLSVLAPPGAWGADVVVGEGQGFGMAPSFGGPLLGLFACRQELLRFSPGRIVGATKDREGRRAFTLTLQTREQHIRRSRATSNICTNQSLLALGFVVYASLVGPKGLAEIQSKLAEKARTLASSLSQIDGLMAPRFDAPYLSSFTLGLKHVTPETFLDRLRRRKVLGGHSLADPRPGKAREESRVLVAVSEATDEKDLRRYATAARAAALAPKGDA